MTAIAGLIDGGKVWMGADSAGVAGLKLAVRRDPKIFRLGEFLFGYTSSFRMGQILRYYLQPAIPDEGQDGHRYMVLKFIPAVRKLLKEHGYLKKEHEREEIGTFLVGWRGELYSVDGDLQVGQFGQPFTSCGCGQDLVLGSLHTTEQLSGLSPSERIQMALHAAETFSAGVRGPFMILST